MPQTNKSDVSLSNGVKQKQKQKIKCLITALCSHVGSNQCTSEHSSQHLYECTGSSIKIFSAVKTSTHMSPHTVGSKYLRVWGMAQKNMRYSGQCTVTFNCHIAKHRVYVTSNMTSSGRYSHFIPLSFHILPCYSLVWTNNICLLRFPLRFVFMGHSGHCRLASLPHSFLLCDERFFCIL